MAPKKAPARAPAKAAVKPAATKAKPKPGAVGGSMKKTSAGQAGAKSAPAAGKKALSTKGKEGKAEPKKEEKKWTAEDEAARKIQTMVRGKLARKKLEEEKKKKREYEEEMDRLEKEAFVYLVKLEQEKADREYQKEQEERKRRNAEIKRRKTFLEAAFEGDLHELEAILKEVSDLDDKNEVPKDDIGRSVRERHLLAVVDCEDANANTPLSEASSGGHVTVIRALIEWGADPNTQGQFKRTPLYRAAYAGHVDACQTLLSYGADPRLYADDGQQPLHVASQPAVEQLLSEWDVEETERLLNKWQEELERRRTEERRRHDAETLQLEDQVKEIEKDYKALQKQVVKLSQELEKRITEHDTAAESGFDKPEITLAVVHEAEMELEVAKVNLEKMREQLAQAKLHLREQQAQNKDDLAADAMPGLPVLVRELDDVLLRDVGNKIQDSGRWPLIIDPSQQAATFLRYRDTNYVNALSPSDMQPDKVRLALLGSIRFGKPFILDMMMIDMFETCKDRFDEIEKGLMEQIMNKSIMSPTNYLKLVREGDGSEYDKNRFSDMRTSNFRFFILTKNPYPSQELLDHTYPIRAYTPV